MKSASDYFFVTFVILFAIGILLRFIIPPIERNRGRKDAEEKVKRFEEGNTPLSAPCTIIIRTFYTNEIAVRRGWEYGFSLNGAEPRYVKLTETLTLSTGVERNALLGYGHATMTGYKPSVEEPFVFTAVPGGTIHLRADLYSKTEGNTLAWKSNLSFDNDADDPAANE